MAAHACQDLIRCLESFLDGKLAVQDLWEQVLELLYQPPVEDGRLAWAVRKLEGAFLEYFDRFISMDELRQEIVETFLVLSTVTVNMPEPRFTLAGSAGKGVSLKAEMPVSSGSQAISYSSLSTG